MFSFPEPPLTNITWENIETLYTQEEMDARDEKADPKGRVYSLMRDVMGTIKVFYDGSAKDKKPPNPNNVSAHFRPCYLKEGNYTLDFEPWEAPRVGLDLVRLFWEPHLAPEGRARTLYPEPIFLRDREGTYFRNAKMGTSKNPRPQALEYLEIRTPLEPGYSYVPAGIVRSMVVLGKTLRRFNKQQQPDDYYSCDIANPSLSRDSNEKDLILLATPTSTNLVGELLKEHALTIDGAGVHEVNRTDPYDDGSSLTWGVCTRTLESFRTITVITAKHGRSIEAITMFLTLKRQLATLMRWMQRTEELPEEFQILFRVEVKPTDEGPSFKDAKIYAVYVDGKRITPPE